MDTLLEVSGNDEIAQLGRVLEALRAALKNALADADAGQEARIAAAMRARVLAGVFARQEDERERIAHKLHEDSLQSLASLALTLDSLEGHLSPVDQAARDRLSRARSMVVNLIQDLRSLAMELRPPALRDLGLASAVQSRAERLLLDEGVRLVWTASGMGQGLPIIVESNLYRVASEALENIARHANSRNVEITLQRDDRSLTLEIADDGAGFDLAEVLADPDATPGLGILSMRERVALLTGAFSIESAPGQGTRVRVRVPLANGSDGTA